ncbi:hypothetical protein BJ138DRAFT_1176085 [Hygrophoropsis aurantiaca]|uniref:Uncharacterized protein n=1 Tax=Hygrophoropsis aurantiaca TaxID=72124 RepID=A0ACB8ASH3_9AGAM|nr:hypothetical protein BJ138DRAFT_1176085 [Hygrophoropsis aurantiaca]
MSSTFTPSQVVDMSKERDWSMNLGMLDWDSTKIVFTKSSLMEFLKYTGTTVDPGFNNIQKLPRYAIFGKMSAPSEESPDSTTSATMAASNSHARLLGGEDAGDALSTAPPVAGEAQPSGVDGFIPSRRVRTVPGGASSVANLWTDDSQEQFMPTRKVRERPGGNDNIESLFG